MNIDTVVYFQVTDPRAAVYEIANYIVGGRAAHHHHAAQRGRRHEPRADADQPATRSTGKLRGVLDEATGKWGIRVARVELKAIDPPPSIQDAMEKQMRADRDKRAMILHRRGRRGSRRSRPPRGRSRPPCSPRRAPSSPRSWRAEAERQSRILRAQGERAARYLQAQGQAKAIEKVFAASRRASRRRNCSRTSTCRRSRRWRRATRTRSGSCRRTSPSRWRASPGCWARRATTGCSGTSRPRSTTWAPGPRTTTRR